MKSRILRNSILVVLIPILLLFLLLASTAKGQDLLGKIIFDPTAWLIFIILVIIAATLNYTLTWRLLGPINDLVLGDTVFYTDMSGYTIEYEVVESTILAPTAIEEMTSGEFDLTLFTCTVGGKSRVTVRCNRVQAE